MHLNSPNDPIIINPEETLCTIYGKPFPAVGFGTYRFKGEECKRAFREAITTGYRIIDTATFYDNFEPIGEVLKHYSRDDFYLISKVWHDQQNPDDLKKRP